MKLFLYSILCVLTTFFGVFLKIKTKEYSLIADLLLFVGIVSFFYSLLLFIDLIKSNKEL